MTSPSLEAGIAHVTSLGDIPVRTRLSMHPTLPVMALVIRKKENRPEAADYRRRATEKDALFAARS